MQGNAEAPLERAVVDLNSGRVTKVEMVVAWCVRVRGRCSSVVETRRVGVQLTSAYTQHPLRQSGDVRVSQFDEHVTGVRFKGVSKAGGRDTVQPQRTGQASVKYADG